MHLRAKHRRKLHFAVFSVALVPGGVLSIFYAHSLAWIVFMSWVAFWYTPLSAFAAETPVEPEDDD